jgi:hypothetical protein
MGRRRAFFETAGLTLLYFSIFLPAKALALSGRLIRNLWIRCKNVARGIGKCVLVV